jgi:protein O-GlcNAc transferase
VEKKINLQKLFIEKKYEDIISIIENNIPEKQRNAAIINLLGVCRLSKKKVNKEDIVSAINDFQKSYLKEKEIKESLQGFKNFINASLRLFDFENSEKNHQNSILYFENALNFFEQNKNYLGKEESILVLLTRVHKRLNNLDKVRFYLGELINNKFHSPQNICNYIYYNCFSKDWSQLEFLRYGKLLQQNLPIYPKNKLISSNYFKNKKIKIGFLSSDIINNHSVTYFLKTVINNYDKNNFQIYLYLNNKKIYHDETTQFFIDKVDYSHNISDLNDTDAINLIRNDKIDILIDLMGITSDSRLQIIKNRVASKQILWCGYCNTTGVDEMDFIIADKNLIYESEHNLYREKILYLPNIWNCHSGINFKRSINEAPSTQNNNITFGSFNNFNKISDNVIKTWSEILKTVKNSKLILKSSSPTMTSSLLNKFEKENVLESIEFEPHVKNFDEHMRHYKKIDIALDTFPYNGVTTSFEAIWMGVPVLTMQGYNFNSRCGESINKNLNLNCLIAKDEQDYILKAKEFSNHDKLSKIRKKIFDDAFLSPLFDEKNFSKDFFNLLKSVHSKN